MLTLSEVLGRSNEANAARACEVIFAFGTLLAACAVTARCGLAVSGGNGSTGAIGVASA